MEPRLRARPPNRFGLDGFNLSLAHVLGFNPRSVCRVDVRYVEQCACTGDTCKIYQSLASVFFVVAVLVVFLCGAVALTGSWESGREEAPPAREVSSDAVSLSLVHRGQRRGKLAPPCALRLPGLASDHIARSVSGPVCKFGATNALNLAARRRQQC